MPTASPLPSYLVQRYKGWKATTYDDNKAWYRHLAEELESEFEKCRRGSSLKTPLTAPPGSLVKPSELQTSLEPARTPLSGRGAVDFSMKSLYELEHEVERLLDEIKKAISDFYLFMLEGFKGIYCKCVELPDLE